MKPGLRKILAVGAWSLFAGGLFVLMSFASGRHQRMICPRLEISIERSAEQFFIVEDDVRELLQSHGHPVEKEPMSLIDVNYLEKLIAQHPAVESVDVFAAVGGEVRIKIVQRRPLVRIINSKDESFYIDDKGKLMPWSENYTAPVLLVNGFVNDGYGNMYRKSIADIEKDTLLSKQSQLDDIYHLASIVDTDPFLKAQVVQAYFDASGRIELTPRVGMQKIVLGRPVDLNEKLGKLITFYREGLNATGNWNKYSVINLEFKNQVVCTKRPQIQ